MGLNITEGSLEREDDYDFIDMADETPDFVIRSIPDGTTFPASRQKLTEASELFRDMFSCCDSDPSSKQSQVLELNESSETITLLLRLIDDSSSHYAFKPSPSDSDLTLPTIPSSVLIPLPLLRPLFALAEKYQLTPTIISSLQFHLSSHAPTDPLEVYSMATLHSIPSIAAQASGYLHSPPLHTYSKERIRMIPTAEAYHQLVVLHEHRISQLREHLKGEEMFPFGYGAHALKNLVHRRINGIFMSR
jgi:hypothetical protein